MKKNVVIYLIRHGETEWSLSGQHTGRTDIPLTKHGELQAKELGPFVRGATFDHVMTSPLMRARETCNLVGIEGEVEVEPDLVEWNYGDYEGKRSADIQVDRKGWNIYADGCPDGESTEQITARADLLIARIRSLQGNIALFSHGQFGSVFATRWVGLPIIEAPHFPLHTASLSILSSDPKRPEVPVIELWNFTAYSFYKSLER